MMNTERDFLMAYSFESDSDIYHHGIKGQKWGIRRYQNTDGSLTEEGTKRYNRKLNKHMKRQELIQRKIDDVSANKADSKYYKRSIEKRLYGNKTRGYLQYKARLNGAKTNNEIAIKKIKNEPLTKTERKIDRNNKFIKALVAGYLGVNAGLLVTNYVANKKMQKFVDDLISESLRGKTKTIKDISDNMALDYNVVFTTMKEIL